jgi:hypothetical protein
LQLPCRAWPCAAPEGRGKILRLCNATGNRQRLPAKPVCPKKPCHDNNVILVAAGESR